MLRSIALPPTKALLAIALGVTTSGFCMLFIPSDRWLESILLSFPLCWAAVVDFDRQILPDLITLGLITAGLLFAITGYPPTLLDRAIGAIVGFVALVLVRSIYAKLRNRDGLGLGDAKLFAAAGAWLGWLSLANVMLAASITALAFISVRYVCGLRFKPNERLAFGPFLATAIWLIWLM